MAGFRFLVTIVSVLIVGVGFVNGEEGEASDVLADAILQDNPVVLGGVEICGPIYDAFLYLAPRDNEGELDLSKPDLDMLGPGAPIAYLPFPKEAVQSKILQLAAFLRLDEIQGKVAAVHLTWDGTVEENTPVWRALSDLTREPDNAPIPEDKTFSIWEKGRLQIVANREETMEMLSLSMFCVPLRGRLVEAMNSGSGSADEAKGLENGAKGEREPLATGLLGRAVLEVVFGAGIPARDPVHVGPDCFGLYYEKSGYMGVPTNGWTWFVGGKSVYVGMEFPSPSGPRNAPKMFFGIRQEIIEAIGEPDEIVDGGATEHFQARWRKETVETILTLETADESPWFLIEFVDTKHIHEIDGELWPGRVPLEKYVPPPVDSGKTRQDLITGNARG